MRYLALDVGVKRVGLAVGSTEVRIASPLTVIERGTIESDAAAIRAVVDKYQVERLVVGVPHDLDGSAGLQAEKVLRYIERLQPEVRLPIEYSDERYSTLEALARQREAGLTERQGRRTVDAAAAAVILQDFLDRIPDAQDREQSGQDQES